ncbi:MAG: GNAT family N-acetyltransferase [Rhizobiaceae bacterium]|nr:GNAT family N-acetyltransferase [Rhizobiaceae bacterium]
MCASEETPPEPIAVTVVFLEMRSRPRNRVHPPVNRSVALLKTRAIPLSFYRYLMDRVGRRWHWVNRLRLSDEELETILRDPACEITVLNLDGAPAGFFELHRVGSERVELSYFGLMEQAIGQGLGRWFLSSAVDAAWMHDPQVVTVQTCTLDHPAALQLYQRAGFSPVGAAEELIYPLSPEERAAVLAR